MLRLTLIEYWHAEIQKGRVVATAYIVLVGGHRTELDGAWNVLGGRGAVRDQEVCARTEQLAAGPGPRGTPVEIALHIQSIIYIFQRFTVLYFCIKI